MAENTTRRAAIVGGNRIPFARSNSAYAQASNQDMLTATLDGLVARFGLQGESVGEVVAGAVLKHARDFNLTREAVLGSRLAPTTPAYDVQQACGTGLEAAVLVANKMDLRERLAVSRQQGQQMAQSLNMQYFETSALDGAAVDEPFLAMGQLLHGQSGGVP